jgi:hypothetical protein
MCWIHCHVRINGTLSRPGVPRGPRIHHGTHQHEEEHHHVRQVERGVSTNPGVVEEGGTVLTVHPGGADGVQPPTADHRPTVTYHRPTGEAVPAPMGRSYRVEITDTDPDRQMG